MEHPISQIIFRESPELASPLERAAHACEDAYNRFVIILGKHCRPVRTTAQLNLRRGDDFKLRSMGSIRANKSDADDGRL
jgi:hypothetical protein